MRTLADSQRVDELIGNLADGIANVLSDGDSGQWVLVGVRDRGDELAQRIATRLKQQPATATLNENLLGVGSLDITLYRDDLSEIGAQAVVQTTDIPFELDGVHVVLVDDVLMTGRSIRAAMQSLIDLGRPKRIWLAVLADRGGRELPIHADFVGLDLSGDALKPNERVAVKIQPRDDEDAVTVEAAS